MKLCVDCAFCHFVSDNPDAMCAKTVKTEIEENPKDYVFGGKTTWKYQTCQSVREDKKQCAPSAEWFTPKR